MKKIVSFIVPFIALFSVLLIPYSFIYQRPIRNTLDKVLHLKVDPVFSGGEIMAKFMDPADDDFGEGTLTYPHHRAFDGKGYLDIVRYTVYEPVVQGRWSGATEYWQMAVTLGNTGNPLNAPLGLSHPVIHIYIDIDGTKSGSLKTASPGVERVSFDGAHPWDFMVHIDGFGRKGFIISHDNTYNKPVNLIYVPDKKTVYARIPLDDKRLKRVLDGRTTFHYVLVGACDQLADGGFMDVAKTANTRNGGGARSKFSPRVYDWVQPKGTDQEKVLSSYDESKNKYAALVPLEVKKSEKTGEALETETNQTLLAKYKKQLQEENEKKKKKKPVDHSARIKQLLKEGAKGMRLATAYFQAQQYDKAETVIRRVLETEPDNAPALTYLGTVTAMKAGKAESPFKAMEFVNAAFDLYEKALPVCKSDDETVTALTHRANVYLRIPEDVFRKSADAAKDFLKAAEILEGSKPKDRNLILDCRLNAGLAYERAGKPEEAEICFAKLKSMKNLPVKYVVALLERGYNPFKK